MICDARRRRVCGAVGWRLFIDRWSETVARARFAALKVSAELPRLCHGVQQVPREARRLATFKMII